MRFLPVFLDLTSGPVVLVGSTSHAAAKVRLLRAANATVRWYPGHADGAEDIQQTAGRGQVDLDFSDPLTADVTGAIAVVSALGDARDGGIAARARAAGIPVNVVDRADLS